MKTFKEFLLETIKDEYGEDILTPDEHEKVRKYIENKEKVKNLVDAAKKAQSHYIRKNYSYGTHARILAPTKNEDA